MYIYIYFPTKMVSYPENQNSQESLGILPAIAKYVLGSPVGAACKLVGRWIVTRVSKWLASGW